MKYTWDIIIATLITSQVSLTLSIFGVQPSSKVEFSFYNLQSYPYCLSTCSNIKEPSVTWNNPIHVTKPIPHEDNKEGEKHNGTYKICLEKQKILNWYHTIPQLVSVCFCNDCSDTVKESLVDTKVCLRCLKRKHHYLGKSH